MRISVALASYNGEPFIAQQLQSLADQLRAPDEIVVADDGSRDRTPEIVREFARSSGVAVRLLTGSQPLGFNRNFERAILACTGDIICLSDQDDVWFREKIETVVRIFVANPNIQVVLNGQLVTDADLLPGRTVEQNRAALGVRSEHLVTGCATSMRIGWAQLLFPMPRSVDALFKGGFMAHDRWINELANLVGVRAYAPEPPLQYWRRHEANVTSAPLHSVTFPSHSRPKLRFPGAPRHAWMKRLDVLEAFEDFIRLNVNQIGSLPSARALKAIAKEQDAITRRLRLYDVSRWRRADEIFKLWLRGGYRYHQGLKSAVHDLLRR